MCEKHLGVFYHCIILSPTEVMNLKSLWPTAYYLLVLSPNNSKKQTLSNPLCAPRMGFTEHQVKIHGGISAHDCCC